MGVGFCVWYRFGMVLERSSRRGGEGGWGFRGRNGQVPLKRSFLRKKRFSSWVGSLLVRLDSST